MRDALRIDRMPGYLRGDSAVRTSQTGNYRKERNVHNNLIQGCQQHRYCSLKEFEKSGDHIGDRSDQNFETWTVQAIKFDLSTEVIATMGTNHLLLILPHQPIYNVSTLK